MPQLIACLEFAHSTLFRLRPIFAARKEDAFLPQIILNLLSGLPDRG